MRIVVVGGGGLIGQRVVAHLRSLGHEAMSASPRTGVDAVTGAGLKEALTGAEVVVDVTNAPKFADDEVRAFFEQSTRNLLSVGRNAGVTHHVALSIVGVERLPGSGYFRAKVVQERLIAESGTPYTIIRATQFFEFLDTIADAATAGDTVHLPEADLQPIAAADVSSTMAAIAVGMPFDGTLDLAGPDRRPFEGFIEPLLAARHDPRRVVTDPAAGYFGGSIEPDTLVPMTEPPLRGATTFEVWLMPKTP